MDKYLELAKKLNELAKRGVGGESENAKRFLDKLLKKHGISPEQIEGDKIEREYFKLNKKTDERLMAQIFSNILGDAYNSYYQSKQKKTIVSVDCTKAQQIEIQAKYDFYSKLYEQEVEIFYSAFIQRNELWSTKTQKSERKLSAKELEEQKRILDMMRGIKKDSPLKQLA